MTQSKIKLSFIPGLKEVVLKEIKQYKKLHIFKEIADSVFLDFVNNFDDIKILKSVSRAYLVEENAKYNPLYISNHKSILGALIDKVLSEDKKGFKSFKITCAGSDSPEVLSISRYIQDSYKLTPKEEADLKIHIIKIDKTWELGIQITPRPLSLRDYKVENMPGAMDPTVAYAVNSFCRLDKAESYLNIFSGSGTLLIEAGQCYPNLNKLVGFDNNKKHLSLAIQNIKEAGLIERVRVFEKNIFDKPDLGKFDSIVSDLPFGMVISKNENLEDLYSTFLDYASKTLNKDGTLCVFTSEHGLFEKVIKDKEFIVIKKLKLEMVTNVNTYLKPVIFVCKLK